MVNKRSKKNQNQNQLNAKANANANANNKRKSVQKQKRKSVQQQQRRKSVQQQQQKRKGVQQQQQQRQQRRKSVQKKQQRQQRRKSLNRTNQRNKRQRSRKNSNKRRKRQRGGYASQLDMTELPKRTNESGQLVADFDSKFDYGEKLGIKQGDFFDAEVGNDGDLSLDVSVLQTRDGREGRQSEEEARRSVTEMSDRRAKTNADRINEDILEIGKLMTTERVYHNALDTYKDTTTTNAAGEKIGIDDEIEVIKEFGGDNVARGRRIAAIEGIQEEKDKNGVVHQQAKLLLDAYGPGGDNPPEDKTL